MGSTFGNLKQFDKALGYFFDAAKFDSTDISVYYFIGMTYQNLNDTVKGKFYLEKANRMKEEQEK